jgi:hypothetical protein
MMVSLMPPAPHDAALLPSTGRVGSKRHRWKGPIVIQLTAGQEMVLATADGQPLTRVQMGLGWDKAKTAGFIGTGAPDVDLDASAAEYGEGPVLRPCLLQQPADPRRVGGAPW